MVHLASTGDGRRRDDPAGRMLVKANTHGCAPGHCNTLRPASSPPEALSEHCTSARLSPACQHVFQMGDRGEKQISLGDDLTRTPGVPPNPGERMRYARRGEESASSSPVLLPQRVVCFPLIPCDRGVFLVVLLRLFWSSKTYTTLGCTSRPHVPCRGVSAQLSYHLPCVRSPSVHYVC